MINPEDLISIVAVKPKLNSQRIQSQKGAFLLYGLNRDTIEEAPSLFSQNTSQLKLSVESQYHPLVKVTKIRLSPQINMRQLNQLGVSKAYIYPEMDRVSEHLKNVYSES